MSKLQQQTFPAPGPLPLDERWFHLHSIERLQLEDGYVSQLRLTDYHVFFVPVRGKGEFRLDEERYPLCQDSVYACPPGRTFGLSSAPGGLELFVLRFDALHGSVGAVEEAGRDKGGWLPGGWPEAAGELAIHTDTEMGMLCESIFRQLRSECGLKRFRAQMEFQELIYRIVRDGTRLAENSSHTALERTRTYMEQHLQDNVTIELLARQAEISPKYYVELFKKTYGLSAMDYLTDLRISRAKQLMLNSGARLRDIAHQVGYQDEFYFSRKFKKKVGVSPTAYLQSRRRKIAAYTPAVIGHMLVLGFIPYAAPLHPKWPAHYYSACRDDISVHLNGFRVNEDWETNIGIIEQIRPEAVICMDNLDSAQMNKLQNAAPVICIPWTTLGWRDHLRHIAEAVELPDEAERWLQAYERKAQQARRRLAAELGNETVLVLRIFKKGCYVHSNRSMTEVLYGDLQVTPACPLGEASSYNREITAEQLAHLAPDRIFVLVCQEDESLHTWRDLQASADWQGLQAVRAHQVYMLTSFPWREYSACAHDLLVDEAVRLLTGNRP